MDAGTGGSRELLPVGDAGWLFVAGTSPDDRVIYLLRGDYEADIWLLTLGEESPGG